MFKLLFLPRGYLTLIALFWAYEHGLLDSMFQTSDSPVAAQIVEWLNSAGKQEGEFATEPDSMPPAEYATLKNQILEELSAFDPPSVETTPSRFEYLQSQAHDGADARDGEQSQSRSEIPQDIKNYLHKYFR